MEIKIENCNNIKNGKIEIAKNSLNIKFGMNGTGKSTIAKAIINRNKLDELKPFGSDDEPKVTIDDELGEVLVFNNDFINSITFNGSEVIEKN